jgi:hypothetical protein
VLQICFGDFVSAEAHLNGMVLLLQHQIQQQANKEPSAQTQDEVEDELTDRYSLLYVIRQDILGVS